MNHSLSAELLHAEPHLQIRGVHTSISFPTDWSPLLPHSRIHLILNLEGEGILLGDGVRLMLPPQTVGLIRRHHQGRLHASRLPGHPSERFAILSASTEWLHLQFGTSIQALHPVLHSPRDRDQLGQIRSLSLAERDLVSSILSPPIPRELRHPWFHAKAIECFSLFAASPQAVPAPDPGRQRVELALDYLRQHLDQELDLARLSRHVGCAPHYLSRQVRQITGITLSHHLRRLRIDRAARLLHEGRHNVTEAALEVGYQSLSHFTKAFVSEKGVRPSEWRSDRQPPH